MPDVVTENHRPMVTGPGLAATAESRLRAHVETLQRQLRKRDDQRRAMLHIVGDLNESNKRLADQRKAMLHILADYDQNRRRPARHRARLDHSRGCLSPLLQGSDPEQDRSEANRKT